MAKMGKMNETIIRADGLTKAYTRYKNNRQKISSLLFGRETGHRRKALTGVSLEVRRGEKIGVIGMPLSGRTTLMKILCGVIEPDSGTVEVSGRVTPVLDYTAGFHTAMSGLDNYRLRCRLLGWSDEEAAEHEDAVFGFAGIPGSKKLPMRQYKKGRARRLGFAVSTEMKPDILIFDETFNFGAKTFSDKAARRLKKLVDGGDTTFIMTVTERTYASKLCERGIVLNKGRVAFDGPFAEALEYYDSNVKPTAGPLR